MFLYQRFIPILDLSLQSSGPDNGNNVARAECTPDRYMSLHSVLHLLSSQIPIAEQETL